MEIVGTQQQGPAGRKRLPNRERPTAEDDALNQIAREAEARLAAKRAARAEAREIRMKELERQQKEIYQVQKKYYGLDTKFGDIEQWMEDSERYTRKPRRNASASDEDECISVGSRGSRRSDLDYASTYAVAGLEKDRTQRMNFKTTNGYEEDMYGSSQSRKSSRASCYSDLSPHCSGFPSKSQPSSQNGNRPSLLYSDTLPARSYRASLYDENCNSGNRRYSASSSRPPSEYSCYLGSGSRASSRASSARASPVVEERPEKDFEKGVRTVSSLSAATLASLGGTSSRRGSGDTSISVDTEASIREIKDINELKDQIQDVEGKYMQGLKEMKDSLAEVEEKYKKAMVSNAQLDNEKTNFMYQVDTLKDALLELEEQLAESKRQYEEKSKDFEREKHAHTILKFQFMEVKETLKQREELLAALERQKEFFDSVRSERDDLREEVIVLKEQLKQHGIIPSSEVTINGETSGDINTDGLTSSSKIVPGSSHVPKIAGEDTLGRANEVEMKNEILENLGKREILQNTEHEEHTEETKEQAIVQECSEIKTLHADENAEAEKITEGKVLSTLLLNSGLEEPAKSHSEHVPGIVCPLENSGVVESRGEGGSHGDTIEVKESDANVVNKTGNQNKIAGPATEANRQIDTGLEILPQQQNKEKQTDNVVDEAEGDNNEVFQEALDFVNNSQMAISSQLESPELAEDMLTKVPNIDPYNEQPENKIVESGLQSQLLKGGGTEITDKAEWDKNVTGGMNEENEMENAVLQPECKGAAEQTEMLCTGGHTSDEFVEAQKQVEIEKTQPLSSKDDTFFEGEQTQQVMEASEKNTEESPTEETDQRKALLEALDAHLNSVKKNEQSIVKEDHTEETGVDGVSYSECQTPEERNLDLEDNSKKCRDIKPEFVDDGKILSDTQMTHEEVADDSHEEDYNPTQVNDWPTEDHSVNKQDETIQESARTASIKMQDIEVPKRNEENKNQKETEEKVLDVVPDIEKASCSSQKAEVSGQERKLDSEEEEEEVVEEYHEAFDFAESPFGQVETIERCDNQNNELEKNNHQTQEREEMKESAAPNVIKEDCEKECRDKGRAIEENKKDKSYQISADEVVTKSENILQQQGKEFEEAEHFQPEPSVSESSKAQCEMLESASKQMLGEISITQIAEYTAEQLEKLENAVDESQEETQMGKKGKGKSREDCMLS
ncbi:leucine-rich repeat flightless-interacting protein 1 isoform X6 [Rhineura floridana]|uniref:leucine-rich repeat flightless-interacting protein 1 isoform X6 n=1 Tax=Rhineura floridana TaxID=261503 RepID=UPI002AC84455|nr:leucine-rich repeat flightless-interacting protein 1 isoform X6 [Rhineura floridana]